MASVAGTKRRNDFIKYFISINSFHELEKEFEKPSNSLLLELSITRTIFDSPLVFELWRAYCIKINSLCYHINVTV